MAIILGYCTEFRTVVELDPYCLQQNVGQTI